MQTPPISTGAMCYLMMELKDELLEASFHKNLRER